MDGARNSVYHLLPCGHWRCCNRIYALACSRRLQKIRLNWRVMNALKLIAGTIPFQVTD